MIKIDHKDIDKIAENYFNKVKSDCTKRVNFFSCLLDVIQNGASTLTIKTHGLHGATKKLLVNQFITVSIANQNEYSLVTLPNIKPLVIANVVGLRSLINHLSDFNNLKKLILVKPEDAVNMDDDLQAMFGINNLNREVFNIIIKGIINYGFYDHYAYGIASELGLSTCPYCNRNFIHTVIDEDGENILRPTFDHFFPQVKHPFLSLSFYNLIPACYNCNSNLKNQATMSLDTNLHPYLEGFGDDAIFYVVIQDILPDKSHPKNYKIDIVNKRFPPGDKHRCIFGTNINEGNVNLFKLIPIYQSHLDVVGELVVKCDRLSKGYANSLSSLFTNLKTNQTEFYRFYFGNYLDDKDHHRRPLAKMCKDVVKQVLPNFLK